MFLSPNTNRIVAGGTRANTADGDGWNGEEVQVKVGTDTKTYTVTAKRSKHDFHIQHSRLKRVITILSR